MEVQLLMCGQEINYLSIGKNIRKYRKKNCHSQEWLAEKVNVGTTHISHIETGNTKLSLATLIKIANALEVSADEILCDDLTNSKEVFISEIHLNLDDCSEEELKFICDLVIYTKKALRKRNIFR